jgi:hypothetical protein
MAADAPPAWPDPATFTAGAETIFRLPCFAGFYAYPKFDPLYNVLWLPKDYDPERAYPLCVQYQMQNDKPSAGVMNWFLNKTTTGGAIVLGVSMVFTAENEQARSPQENAIQAGTIHWVMEHWNIDRSRVFVGGFSAGGWSASQNGMTTWYRNLSTHFLILGAGTRGVYHTELFPGAFAFIGSGDKDFNHQHALQAITELQGAKFNVTTYADPDLDHNIGQKEMDAVAAWYTTFDPAAHAQEWLDEATKALAAKTVKDRAAVMLKLASVATLGPKSPQGAAARELLAKQEGAALTEYERGWTLLRQRRYLDAKKAFAAALAQAVKLKSERLAQLATKAMPQVAEWQCCEELLAVISALGGHRPAEAALLAADGAARYKDELKGWDEGLFQKCAADAAKQSPPSDTKLRAAHTDLAKWRVALYEGKLGNAKDNAKATEALSAIVTAFPDSAEAAEATALKARLPEVEVKGKK